MGTDVVHLEYIGSSARRFDIDYMATWEPHFPNCDGDVENNNMDDYKSIFIQATNRDLESGCLKQRVAASHVSIVVIYGGCRVK